MTVYNGQFDGRFAQVGAANAPVSITIETPGIGSARSGLSWLHWSYDGTPTGGAITLTAGTLTYTMFITTGGPGFLPFSDTLFPPGQPVTITLAAGGASVRGSLAALGVKIL